MDKDNRTCEAGDLGWDDCENPATTTAKVDADKVNLCKECYEGAAYATWAHWYRSAAR